MKICIVTIYNSSNYGACLQALVLRDILEQRGHEVIHLNTGARNPMAEAIKRVKKKLMAFDWKKDSLIFEWKKGLIFAKEAKTFRACGVEEASEADMVIFGSDEIWNAKREMIYRYPMLFGKGIDSGCKASYAVSINSANEEDFHNYPDIIEELDKFKKITVRDSYSKDVLGKLLPDKDISVVVDPTLLPERSYYEGILEETEQTDYILVYSYGTRLKSSIIKQMKEYAREHKLRLISVLSYFPWCDENVSCSIKEFLGLIRDAKVVFTDTFHGTIFSVIFEKEFVVISKGAKKLNHLLKELDLEHRKVGKEPDSLFTVSEKDIDYAGCNESLEKLRQQSLQQLEMILEGNVE